MNTTLGPIATQAAKSRGRLKELCRDVDQRSHGDGALPLGVDVDVAYLEDCLARFNVWVASIGVFQKGEASIDFRLSNKDLSDEILRLLRQLETFVGELEPIIQGHRQQMSWDLSALDIAALNIEEIDDFSDDESDIILTPESSDGTEENSGPMTESKDLCLSINQTVTSLLRLSIQIHKSSKRAKFARSSTAAYYEIGPDINHVRSTFPHAADNSHLVEKLAKANAQRRQWLWYRSHHREKLSVDLSGQTEERIPWGLGQIQSDIGSLAQISSDESHLRAPPSLSETRASTIPSRLQSMFDTATSSYPETQFGRSSRAVGDETRVLVPEPPNEFVANQPFTCHYCCNVVELKASEKSTWQKHVHSDLSSYTCVFEKCNDMLFESRHKWWQHEMEVHRRRWHCPKCDRVHSKPQDLKHHLLAAHTNQGLPPLEALDDFVSVFARPMTHIPASDCPLCDYPAILLSRGYSEHEVMHLTPEKFCRHLGRHLEQLALFVLPQEDLVDDDDYEGSLGNDRGDSEFGDEDANDGANLVLSEPELIANLDSEALLHPDTPEIFTELPDIAARWRWQPPHDFTPPQEDFQTDDNTMLPMRQEPIFGGDLHTPGWARGLPPNEEGYCGRCLVPHWVNISDGSYRFHLTYFYGVPDSGVPLPRPSTIRPHGGRQGMWEAYCEACDRWKILKKTKRGWSWYRHWLHDHADIVKQRTDAVRQGSDPEKIGYETASKAVEDLITSEEELQEAIRQRPDLLSNDNWLARQLVLLSRQDMINGVIQLLEALKSKRSIQELRALTTARSESDETLLMISAARGHQDVVDRLLGYGADPNLTGPDDRTALDFAADAGYFNICQQLLRAGADASISPVFKQVFSNENEYAGEMTEAAAKKAEQKRGEQRPAIDQSKLLPLSRAAYDGDLDEVRRLLASEGTDPEEGAETGYTPFLLASMHNHTAIMGLLLAYGANINATNKFGWTSLMLATRRSDAACLSYLLAQSADVNHLSPDHWTALAEATSRGDLRLMKALLDAGAETELRSQHDWTPLMHAAYRGDVAATNLLLDAGASIKDISARDETVLLLATAAGSAAVVRRLLAAGCPPESEWSKTQEVDTGDSTNPQHRIERKYTVGWTPLMVACQVGSLEIVKMLLDAGASHEPKSPLFKTALEIAREQGWTEIVDYLVERLGDSV